MNIFGIGLPEMAVIAAIGLLVFGPKRLPELGKTLGRTLRGFQSASQEFEQEFRSAIAFTEAETSTAATSLPASHDAAMDHTATSIAADGTPALASVSEPSSVLGTPLASGNPVEVSPQPAETLG